MNNRRGFTLPELLIVLLVLGILVGIAFMVRGPVLSGARQTAWDSTMSSITHALNNASLENDDKYAVWPTGTPATAITFSSFASLLNVTPTRTLADFLDKSPLDPWNKNAVLNIVGFGGSLVDLTGAGTIKYETTAANDHFRISYLANGTTSTVSDSVTGLSATYTH